MQKDSMINNDLINSKRRLFTFGCSITKYYWPTWADILGRRFEYYENWAMPSAGNLYIFNSIIEANQRHKFNKDDLIMIVWSGITRHDYYRALEWAPRGPEFNMTNNDPRGYEIINFGYIQAIKTLLESIGISYSMRAIGELHSNDDVYTLYKDSLANIHPFKIISLNKSVNIKLSHTPGSFLYETISAVYYKRKLAHWPEYSNYICGTDSAIDDLISTTLVNHSITNGVVNIKKDWHPGTNQHLAGLVNWIPDLVVTDTDLEFVNKWEDHIQNNTLQPFMSPGPKIRL